MYLKNLDFLCAIQISPNIFVPIVKLDLEHSIPSLFYGIQIDCCTFGGSRSRSCVNSFIGCWAWDSSSFLGHLWCSYPFDLYSYLGKICGFGSNLGDMDFSFRLWCCYCCFLHNFAALIRINTTLHCNILLSSLPLP